jgi:D-amino-acid dehydrogenase
MRTIVLGAGVNGVTTGYFLAQRGHEVVVVDRQSEPANETSYANGGVIGGTQVEPWAKAGLPWKILAWLGQENAPLLVRFNQLPRIWRWGHLFIANCTDGRFRRNLAANVALTRYSLDEFARFRADAGIDGGEYDLCRRGALKVFNTMEAFTAAQHTTAYINDLGIPVRVLGPQDAARIEPALVPTLGSIVGALHYPDEEIGDCRKFTQLVAHLGARLGIEFRYGTTAHRLVLRNGRVAAVETSAGPISGDRFVVALASYSAPFLRSAGLSVPVVPVKGVTVTVSAEGWDSPLRAAVVDHSRLFGLIRIGDRIRASGSAEITGYDRTPSASRCQALLDNVVALFPAFANCLRAGAPIRWAGVRGNTPDGRPILGPTPLGNLFLNIGHGPQGWSTSCGASRLVADMVSGLPPAIDPEPLTLRRFRRGGRGKTSLQ